MKTPSSHYWWLFTGLCLLLGAGFVPSGLFASALVLLGILCAGMCAIVREYPK